MKRKLLTLCAASLAGACALEAADGDLIAEDTTGAAFAVYSTDDATYAAKSTAEIAALPSVTWRAGETVTAAKWNGDATMLATSAASDGSGSFAPNAGGAWTLVNSRQGTAYICVPWSVFGDSMSVTSVASPTYAADSRQEGPDRTTRRKEAPAVSYTGDNWLGDAAKAATLTFISPGGVTTTLDREGTGSASFDFNELGDWTVVLAMADGSTRTAVVSIDSPGLVLMVR